MDNGAYQITGGQKTHDGSGRGYRRDRSGVGVGVQAHGRPMRTRSQELIGRALKEDGPWLIGCRIDNQKPVDTTERDPSRIRDNFMRGLGRHSVTAPHLIPAPTKLTRRRPSPFRQTQLSHRCGLSSRKAAKFRGKRLRLRAPMEPRTWRPGQSHRRTALASHRSSDRANHRARAARYTSSKSDRFVA